MSISFKFSTHYFSLNCFRLVGRNSTESYSIFMLTFSKSSTRYFGMNYFWEDEQNYFGSHPILTSTLFVSSDHYFTTDWFRRVWQISTESHSIARSFATESSIYYFTDHGLRRMWQIPIKSHSIFMRIYFNLITLYFYLPLFRILLKHTSRNPPFIMWASAKSSTLYDALVLLNSWTNYFWESFN